MLCKITIYWTEILNGSTIFIFSSLALLAEKKIIFYEQNIWLNLLKEKHAKNRPKKCI